MNQYDAHEDNLQVRLAQDVDHNFEEFIKVYERYLCRYAEGLGEHSTNAKEIVQDTFVKMYWKLKGWETQKIRDMNLKAYLSRIVFIEVILRDREQRKRYYPLQSRGSLLASSNSDDEDILDNCIDERAVDPEQYYLQKEQVQALLNVLSSLSEEAQWVVRAHLDGWTFQAIADHLGKSMNTVKSTWRRSREFLRSATEM